MDTENFEITLTVDKRLIIAAAEAALTATFKPGSHWEAGGKGYDAIRIQAEAWARNKDYYDLIRELAPSLINDALLEALKSVVQKEVRKAVKAMVDTGELLQVVQGK